MRLGTHEVTSTLRWRLACVDCPRPGASLCDSRLANGLNSQPNVVLQARRKGRMPKIRVDPDAARLDFYAQCAARIVGYRFQTTL